MESEQTNENELDLAPVVASSLPVNKSDLIKKGKRNNYKFDQKLGKGSFGSVWKATHIYNGAARAIKKIKMKYISDMKAFKQELNCLKELDHPNILKLYEYFLDKEYIYLVTELCEGGDFFEKITQNGSFNEEKTAFYFKQLLQALNHCHSNGICHRDLKSENLMLENNDSDSTLTLIDFGGAKRVGPPPKEQSPGKRKKNAALQMKMKTTVGSLNYCCPELISGSYDMACDL